MKPFFTLLAFLLSCMVQAQNNIDYSIRINADVQTNPAQITLKWEATVTTGNIFIYRKAKDGTSWGSHIATFPATTNTYTDNNVTAGNGYEYYIYSDDSTIPKGYIYAGLEAPAIHNRGAILLLVDSTFSDSCSTEIATLVKDLSGDGWEVLTKHFARTETLPNIKNYITTAYSNNPKLSALYILGHLPVPYSGDLNPDAHTNHKGAWPADAYYGDMNSSFWTDNSINNTSSNNARNHNIPGDGNFDQSYIPGDIELQVGRVDVSDMPAFGKTEIELMRSYLNKAHQYKTAALAVIKRGLIDDNFSGFEAFSANGWRNFAPLVGIDSVSEKDLISTLNTDFHQWAYGTGPGSYTNCGGVGNTNNIAANSMKSIFTILFGSYFGDWNYRNNFLRAPLCADEPALASFWAGRPNWFLHHMAMGESIGYATRLSQNNTNLYVTPIPQMARLIHIALMGDPSLRTEYVKPVPAVTTNANPAAGAEVSWTASTETGLSGYYVYRATSEYGEYKLRSGLVSGTAFTDSFGNSGTYWYMVRPAKLQSTPSGTYYNLGLGASSSGTFTYPYFEVGVGEITTITSAQIAPNPAGETAVLHINTTKETMVNITITNLQGKTVQHLPDMSLHSGHNTRRLSLASLTAGMYIVNIKSANGNTTLKLAKTY